MKPMIDQAFWSDPDVEATKAGTKLAALWLITNSQTSQLGICNATPARFSFETGLPANALDNAIEALPRAFKRFGTVVFLRNYIRHQFGIGEKLTKNNFFISLKSLFLAVKDEQLRGFIAEEYPEFLNALSDGRIHRNERDHAVCAGLRDLILQRDCFECVITGERLDESELQIDHVHPLSKGGRTEAENLVAMSAVLNTKKNLKDLKTFCDDEGFNYEIVMQRVQTRALKPLLGLSKPKYREGKVGKEGEGEGMQGEGAKPTAPRASKPRPKARHTHPDIATKEDVLAFASELGLPATDGEWFFSKNEGAGWMVQGRPIINWRETFRGWNIQKIFPSHKQHEKTALADRRNGGNRNAGHNATVASGYGNRPAQTPNGAA